MHSRSHFAHTWEWELEPPPLCTHTRTLYFCFLINITTLNPMTIITCILLSHPPFFPPRSLRDIPCALYYPIPYSRTHLLFWLGQPWDSAKVSLSFEMGLVPFRSCLHETFHYLQRPSSTKSTFLSLRVSWVCSLGGSNYNTILLPMC